MQVPVGYDAITRGPAWVVMPGWSLHVLGGQDAWDWLQGQLSQDLSKAGEGPGIDACHLSVTGQIETVCRVWASEDGLNVACQDGSVLERLLEDFVILEDVTSIAVPGTVRLLQDPFGERAEASGDVPTASYDAYLVAMMEAGRPVFGPDGSERILPPEFGAWFDAAHVSYTKGCYPGQEVVQRIHSRGHTNRTWASLAADGPLTPGESLTAGSEQAGIVTRSSWSPRYGHLAGAMLKNKAITPDLELTSETGVSAVLRVL